MLFKTWSLSGGALAELKSEPDTKVQKTHGQRDGSEYFGAKFHILYLQLQESAKEKKYFSERNCAPEQDGKPEQQQHKHTGTRSFPSEFCSALVTLVFFLLQHGEVRSNSES